jgi:protein-S-isoprenylcysteine O-methyltransferase Ste14
MSLVSRARAFNDYVSTGLLGGPRVIRMSWVINLHKGGTILLMPLLMWATGNWSTVAWIYWALHGSYGACWLLKHLAFRDRSWERPVTFASALLVFIYPLGAYWLFPVLVVTRGFGSRPGDPSNALLAGAIALHTIGVVAMMAADAQKNSILPLRPGLITTGLYARLRHPNYLGEMLLYSAYALLARHWLAWVVLGVVWVQLFLVNILSKESSLSRHAEWEAYRRRTGLLLPRL